MSYAYNLCSVILNGEGADGSTTITNSSRDANTFVVAGNARIRTADFFMGSASLYVDGVGDYIYQTSSWIGWLPGAPYATTIEARVRLKVTTAADSLLLGFWKTVGNARSFFVGLSSTRELIIKYSTNGTAEATLNTGVTMALDAWTHIRLTLIGNSGTRQFILTVDGTVVYVSAGNLTVNVVPSAVNCLFSIGGDASGGNIITECYFDCVIVTAASLTGVTPTTAPVTSADKVQFVRGQGAAKTFNLGIDSGVTRYTSTTKKFVFFNVLDFELLDPAQASGSALSPTGTISGTVSILGVPTSRTVRAYRRDTGAYVSQATSDPGTGAYTISVFAGVEHDLVCLDDTAGTVQNDLILRKTGAAPLVWGVVGTTGVALGTDNSGWNGFTVRQVWASPPTGTFQYRVTMTAASGASAVIGGMYIGQGAAAGDNYDFAATPVAITVGGLSSFTIPAGSVVVSDPITVTVASGRGLVVSAYFSGVSSTKFAAAAGGYAGYYKSGNEASTIDATGYTSTSNSYLVTQYETLT